MSKVFAIIGGLVTIVGLIVMTVALNGWALALSWFVVPLGLPSVMGCGVGSDHFVSHTGPECCAERTEGQ